MKLSFERSKLAGILSFVKNSIPKKEIEPVLNNFYFNVISPTSVEIISTDLDLMAVAHCDCTAEGTGAATIPGARLLSLINKLTGDKIQFDCQENTIYITCGNYKGEFKTVGTEDYPEVYKITEENTALTFKRETVLAGLKRVHFAVNEDEARKQLMAVQVSRNGMVASNGKITAVYREEFDVDELCISSNCLKDLISVMDASASENIQIFEEEAYLVFKFGKDLFFTRKTSVNFPEVFNKLDKPTRENNKNILRFKVKDLKAVIQRISLTASEETQSVRLELLTESDVKISARDTKDFSSEETLTYSSEGIELDPTKDPVVLFFNYTHLLDILSKMAGEDIEFKMHLENARIPVRVDEGKTTIFVMRALS